MSQPIAYVDGEFIFSKQEPSSYQSIDDYGWTEQELEDSFQSIEDDFDDWKLCEHGNRSGECTACDAYEESMGGIDKCLNCGRYQWGKKLNKDQCCIKQCRNPNEY